MKAYSQDVRERVLMAVDLGHPRAEIVQLFGIALSTLKRYLKLRREEGHVRPKAIPGRPPTKRAKASSWRAAPVTGKFRRHAGTTLCDVGTGPR
jgi:transposase